MKVNHSVMKALVLLAAVLLPGYHANQPRLPGKTPFVRPAFCSSVIRASRSCRMSATVMPPLSPSLVAHSQLLLDSYERTVGRSLMPRIGTPEEQARALFDLSDRVVVSHGTEDDPILNYGNAVTLRLWEMSFEQLTSTPSRQTAEPMLQEKRQALLDQVREKGYVSDYSGVRISSTGRRFAISNVTIWEVYDAEGVRRGQAATFDAWEWL